MKDCRACKQPLKNGIEHQVSDCAQALDRALEAARLQIRAMEPVVGAARLMVRHQEDHELGSCCHDVTPTNAYLLKRALLEWDAVEKPLGVLVSHGPDGQPCCARCGAKDYPLEHHVCKAEQRKSVPDEGERRVQADEQMRDQLGD
jgi:hypothetical protein